MRFNVLDDRKHGDHVARIGLQGQLYNLFYVMLDKSEIRAGERLDNAGIETLVQPDLLGKVTACQEKRGRAAPDVNYATIATIRRNKALRQSISLPCQKRFQEAMPSSSPRP